MYGSWVRIPAGSQKKPHRNVRFFLCPLGIRIIACSGKGSGPDGHAQQIFIMVRSGKGSGYVFGVSGAGPLPAELDQENTQSIVPARDSNNCMFREGLRAWRTCTTGIQYGSIRRRFRICVCVWGCGAEPLLAGSDQENL